MAGHRWPGRGRGAYLPGHLHAAASVLGLAVAGLVVLVVWLAQQADRRRRWYGVARREGEHRLFQFLGALPVGVFIASPGGQPYYASDEGERLMGRGVVPDIGADQLAESYSVFQAGTGQRYPTESLPLSAPSSATRRTLTTWRSIGRMVR